MQCFWLEETDRVRVGLRRYRSAGTGEEARVCPLPGGYHRALVPIGEAPVLWELDGDVRRFLAQQPEVDHEDPRWPRACECGEPFAESDAWQVFQKHLYRRADTGEETTVEDAGPGAMWDAWWMPDIWKGADGRSLTVKCPNGREWMIDGQASNCTKPDDHEHRCWVRHGDPPNITVDKNGNTCAAGAGSIQAGDYHGFLQGGRFT